MAVSYLTGNKVSHSRFTKDCQQDVVICNERIRRELTLLGHIFVSCRLCTNFGMYLKGDAKKNSL